MLQGRVLLESGGHVLYAVITSPPTPREPNPPVELWSCFKLLSTPYLSALHSIAFLPPAHSLADSLNSRWLCPSSAHLSSANTPSKNSFTYKRVLLFTSTTQTTFLLLAVWLWPLYHVQAGEIICNATRMKEKEFKPHISEIHFLQLKQMKLDVFRQVCLTRSARRHRRGCLCCLNASQIFNSQFWPRSRRRAAKNLLRSSIPQRLYSCFWLLTFRVFLSCLT